MNTRSMHEAEVERAGKRAAKIAQAAPAQAVPSSQPVSILTSIVKHGGLYSLLDAEMTASRMGSINLAVMAGNTPQQSGQAIWCTAAAIPRPLPIPTSCMPLSSAI